MTIQDDLHALQSLKKHPGFLMLNEAIQGQMDQAQHQALIPIKTMDDALEKNTVLGNIAGRYAWIETLNTMISNLQHDLQQRGIEDNE